MARYTFLYPAGIVFALAALVQVFSNQMAADEAVGVDLQASPFPALIDWFAVLTYVLAAVTIAVAIRNWTDTRNNEATA